MCRNALESPLSSKLPPELGPTTRQQKAQGRCAPLSSPSLLIVFVFDARSRAFVFAARDLLLLPPLLLLLQNTNCVPLLLVLFSFFFLTKKTKFSSNTRGVIHDQAQQTSSLRTMNFFSHDPRDHEFAF
jgi:hypothetical protein